MPGRIAEGVAFSESDRHWKPLWPSETMHRAWLISGQFLAKKLLCWLA